MKTLKKLDVIIIAFMLLLSFTPNLIYSQKLNKDYKSTYAAIEVDGKVYDNIYLSSSEGEKTFTIETDHGNNIISIKNGNISITEADCHDSLCVKQGEISKVGQSIICLPHELIIEIKGDEDDSSSDMILSH